MVDTMNKDTRIIVYLFLTLNKYYLSNSITDIRIIVILKNHYIEIILTCISLNDRNKAKIKTP